MFIPLRRSIRAYHLDITHICSVFVERQTIYRIKVVYYIDIDEIR